VTAYSPKAVARPPFLPFLSGPPDFNVGLRPIGVEAWLAPDLEQGGIPSRRALMTTRASDVFRALPGSEHAQAEIEALVHATVPGGRAPSHLPTLMRAGWNISDDLAVMMRGPEGWRAGAALLCSPTFFSAEEAIGKTLIGLHGPVPDRLGPNGAQALGARIGRVFDMLRDGLVLERFNWTVQAGDARFTPDGAPLRALAVATRNEDALDVLHLRVERQTIRLMPESGAVLFTIRIALDPLRALFAVEGARAAFADAWTRAPEHVRAYKKWFAYERLVAAALAEEALINPEK